MRGALASVPGLGALKWQADALGAGLWARSRVVAAFNIFCELGGASTAVATD